MIAEPAAGDFRAISQDTLLSIVVALYNEERVIDALFAELGRVAAVLPCRVEFVCVNDGSRDRTLDALREKLVHDSRIRIVNFARNFGKEAALTAGLAQARGDAVVVIDADLQDPPSLIPRFLEKWQAGYDVVYGVRSTRASDTFFKRTTANAFYKLFNRVTDVKIPPGAGDFRLLDRRAVNALLELPERNRFMKGLFSWVGFRQTGVEFVREARVAGLTSWNYLRLFNFAIDGITSFSIAPLRIASFVGVTASILGFIYAAYLTLRTIIFGVDVPGYASIMVVTMFLGGMQLICLGLIGEYLGRLYIEAKGRPLYIIADVYEAESVREAATMIATEPQRRSPLRSGG
jgi:glycosyltransferase involved in cell wall biosynthesis